MYTQIKDFANMRLYDMIKQVGGTLAFRNTDCAITFGSKRDICETKIWGSYKTSSLPLVLGES
jgi:hypothetical protein